MDPTSTSRNKLVALPQPITLESNDGVASFSLLAASDTAALLECAPWMGTPSPGLRVSLHGRDGFLKAVRFQLTVTEVVDAQKVVAAFTAISAAHRPDYLAKVLQHVLGVHQRITVGTEMLPPGTEVVWDAQRRLVRTRTGVTHGVDLTAPSAPMRAADDQSYHLGVRELAALEVGGVEASQPVLEITERKANRLHPVYPCPNERGFFRQGDAEDLFVVLMTAVGSSHCIFQTPAWTAPATGSSLVLGVPMTPLRDGLTWVPATVSQVSGIATTSRVSGPRARVEVAIDRYSSQLPEAFGRLVGHLGSLEP